MPAVRQEELLLQLAEVTSEERPRLLRLLTNTVIGNRHKKELYAELGIVSSLATLLKNSTNTADGIRICHILGSIAYGDERSRQALVKGQVGRALLDILLRQDEPTLVLAALRALKSLLAAMDSGKSRMLEAKDVRNIVRAVNPTVWLTPPSTVALAARIGQQAALAIAHASGSKTLQSRWAAANAITELTQLAGCGFSKAQEAALEALGNLCYDNNALAKTIIDETELFSGSTNDILARLLRHSSIDIRLLACTCVVNIQRTGLINDREEAIRLTVMPTLMRMIQCGDEHAENRAAMVFAYLVGECPRLQETACETDIINILCRMFESVDDDTSTEKADTKQRLSSLPGRKECTLLSLAAVCSLTEECRRKIVEAKILPRVTAALSHPQASVRAAACMCTRSLSRSVKNLRTSLIDAEIAEPICKLVYDASLEVQSMALTTLCNLVLDFSALKKTVIDQGIIDRLVVLTASEEAAQRVNAIWAIESMLYNADRDIKMAVMTTLTYDRLKSLLRSGHALLQEHAIGLLRNLVCGKEADVDLALEGIGEHELYLLLSNLLRNSHTPTVLQTLYVIANMATGREQHKQCLMSADLILQGIADHLDHPDSQVREAAVWCIINLCWCEQNTGEESRALERIRQLRSLGVVERLRVLTHDESPNIRERASTALEHLSLSFEPLGSAAPFVVTDANT